MASRLIDIRQGKLAGKSDPCGGGVDDSGGSGGKARPSQRQEMNTWTGSGGSEHPPCRAQREDGSSWKESSSCEQPSSGSQGEGSSSQKESSGCEHPSSGVQKGGDKCPSGMVLRTGSPRGKWGSPDRRGGCRASEHPPGGEGKKESSPLDGGEVVCVAAQASQEGSFPCPAGKHSEAVGTPSFGIGGTTAYRHRYAFECGSSFDLSVQPGVFETGIGPCRLGSQCAELPCIGQRECLGCGQPLSCCTCTGVAPRRITSFSTRMVQEPNSGPNNA